MTTTEELQQLSRDAWDAINDSPNMREWELASVLRGHCISSMGNRRIWLHESTEAATEIMVRVLWPAGLIIDGGDTYSNKLDVYVRNQRGDVVAEVDSPMDDWMLAFRVAVLRALVALKGK